MNIEAGKEYITRGGNRARVFMTNGGESGTAVFGAVLAEGKWGSAIWAPDGSLTATYSPALPKKEGDYDIGRRKRTVYLNLYPETLGTWRRGQYVAFPTRGDAQRAADEADCVAKVIPIEIEE